MMSTELFCEKCEEEKDSIFMCEMETERAKFSSSKAES